MGLVPVKGWPPAEREPQGPRQKCEAWPWQILAGPLSPRGMSTHVQLVRMDSKGGGGRGGGGHRPGGPGRPHSSDWGKPPSPATLECWPAVWSQCPQGATPKGPQCLAFHVAQDAASLQSLGAGSPPTSDWIWEESGGLPVAHLQSGREPGTPVGQSPTRPLAL